MSHDIMTCMEEMQAQDIIEITVNNALCNKMLICTARSSTHAKAIAERLKSILKNHKLHIEGLQNAQWVLIDTYEVIIHIMQDAYRKHYDLESLWAKRTT